MFTEDGRAQLPVPLGQSLQDARVVLWRVVGAWLEIDTSHDGTFKTRLRVVGMDSPNHRLMAESPSGKRSVWGYTSVRIEYACWPLYDQVIAPDWSGHRVIMRRSVFC